MIRGIRAAGAGALLVGWLSGAPAWSAEDARVPGAYCPLPEKGEVPRCLEPAQREYGAFFGALDAEGDQDAALGIVEDAVSRGAGDAHAYLALSSLSYGYYRLARRAAAENADPEIALRLARWNDLLARAYSGSGGDLAYREAVRRAAEDLSRKAPVRVPCRDARGEPAECNATESVLRGIHETSDAVGIRGALERLLRRIVGGPGA